MDIYNEPAVSTLILYNVNEEMPMEKEEMPMEKESSRVNKFTKIFEIAFELKERNVEQFRSMFGSCDTMTSEKYRVKLPVYWNTCS